MNYYGNRMYYDKTTGEVFFQTGEIKTTFDMPKSTIEEEISKYKALSERNRETFDVIELEYGQYAQDFAESNGYRVNPETKTLEFSYPNPNDPEVEQPYQAPLSEQVEGLKKDKQLLQIKVDALSSQNEMIEGAIAELAAMTLQ